jgi:hypothetical protein
MNAICFDVRLIEIDVEVIGFGVEFRLFYVFNFSLGG